MLSSLPFVELWPTPNYTNPPTRIWLTPVLVVTWVLTTATLGTRLYLRVRNLAGRYGLDDTIIILAWAFGTVLTAFFFSTIYYDAGRHAWDIPLGNWVHITFNHFISQPVFLLAGGFTKISILLFYRRLSENTIMKWWKGLLIGCIVFTVVWTIAFIIGQIVLCNPVESYWMQYDLTWNQPYSCGVEAPSMILAGVMAVVSDLYATALPCWLVRNLQMAKQTKVGLYVVFSLGLATSAVSVVRTVWITRATTDLDLSFYIYWAMFLIQLETQLGIFCACLPTLNVLIKKRVREPRSKFSRFDSENSKRTPSSRESDERPMYSRDSETKSVEVHEIEMDRHMGYDAGARSFYQA